MTKNLPPRIKKQKGKKAAQLFRTNTCKYLDVKHAVYGIYLLDKIHRSYYLCANG